MIFSDLITRTQDRLAKHRRYRKLVDEISSLSDRDLADFNGNRGELLHHAWRDVYGR